MVKVYDKFITSWQSKHYWWGWQWPKYRQKIPRRGGMAYQYRINWRATHKRKIDVKIGEYPDQKTVHSPDEFMKIHLNPYKENFLLPWPYNKIPETKTKEDLNYKKIPSLLYDLNIPLIEGFKGVMAFSNTVCEGEQLPEHLIELGSLVDVSDDYINCLDRKIQWAKESDGFLFKLHRKKIFPKMQEKPPQVYGIHEIRMESNILSAFEEQSELYAAKNFGIINRRKLNFPKCEIPFLREGQLVVVRATPNFISTVPIGESKRSTEKIKIRHTMSSPLFSNNPTVTVERSLEPIHPVNWKINFLPDHYYLEKDWGFVLNKPNRTIHTIFCGSRHDGLKFIPDRFMKGKAIMFSYAFAVGQARLRYGDINNYKDDSNYGVLPEPITVQCIYANHMKSNIGFVCFQLNTLSFDSDIKNQVWFDGPYDYEEIENRRLIMEKCISLQMSGMNILDSDFGPEQRAQKQVE